MQKGNSCISVWIIFNSSNSCRDTIFNSFKISGHKSKTHIYNLLFCLLDNNIPANATKIGDGVKTDNLSQIGHNVQIGDNTLICAQVGIAGSSIIGKNVVLGGQTGVSDNIFVGDNVITGGATKVLSNIPSGRVMLGYPAMKMETQLEVHRNLRKLPRLLKDLSDLKKAVFKSSKID